MKKFLEKKFKDKKKKEQWSWDFAEWKAVGRFMKKLREKENGLQKPISHT